MIDRIRTAVPCICESLDGLLHRRQTKKLATDLATYFLLIALSIVFLMPFYYMISKSLMLPGDDYNQAVKWLPRSLNISNYRYALEAMDYGRRLVMTIVIVGVSVAAQIITCSLVAYGLARVRVPGGKTLFGLILFTLIIPPQTLIVPQYILFSGMHMVDSYLPIIIPCFFAMGLNGGLVIFILRQFFRGLPRELEDAAMIDGTSLFGCFVRIMLPNSKQALLVTTILSVVWQWNNSFEPSIYIKDAQKQAGLVLYLNYAWGNAVSQNSVFNQCIDVTATLLAILPVILLFLVLQKQFMKGIETTGLAN